MRELDTALICQTVADMVVQANCCIGADVMESLRQGRDREEKPLARSILDKLIRNDEIAARRAMPLCQDTGMAVFRVRLGQELHIVGQPLEEALQQGMAQGSGRAISENPWCGTRYFIGRTPEIIPRR